jgi:oligopeptide transport system substrate-binding protein
MKSALAALVLLACCTACRGTDAPSPKPPRVFGVALPEPPTYDPSLAAEESGTTIARSLFEGLLSLPPGDGPLRPGVAESHEVSPDGRTWTFRLRSEARWSDGRPVVAADFVNAFRRVVDPATASRCAPQFVFLAGAEAIRKGLAAPSTLGVSAPDDRTLVIRLDSPAPFFGQVLTYPAFSPVRRDVIEQAGATWTRPGTLVSNGPFRLAEYTPGVRAVLERNPYWWGASTVALDRVEYRFVDSEQLAYDWFRTGKVHWLKSTLSRDRIPALRRDRPAEFHADPVLCTYYVALRTDRAPFDDVRLRRAVNLAIDKERLVREVLMGGQAQAGNLVPPAMTRATKYVPAPGEGFDPKKARSLLAEVVRDRGSAPEFTYHYNAVEGHRLIAEFVQAQLKENLGLTVKVEASEWKALLDRVHRGDFEAARASWCADYVDAGNFLDILQSGGPNNYPGFADSRYDALLAQARATPDWEGHNAALRRAEEILVAQAPIVPLYFYTRIYLLSGNVTGFEPNVLDVHPLQYLDVR